MVTRFIVRQSKVGVGLELYNDMETQWLPGSLFASPRLRGFSEGLELRNSTGSQWLQVSLSASPKA